MAQMPHVIQSPEIPQTNLLISPYTRSYNTKPSKYETGKMVNYFKAMNVGNKTNYSHMDEFDFAYNVLEAGVPHVVGSWLDSPNIRQEVKGYQTNVIEFDIDSINHLSFEKKKQLEKKLYANFYMVQRSFSSSDNYSDPRYHVYERVIPLENCTYEQWAYAYRMRMEYWEQELGISFDRKQHLLKLIYASGKKVYINKKHKSANLQPYIEEFIEEKKKLKNKKGKVTDRQVAIKLENSRFNNHFKVNGVNFDAIVRAIKKLPSIDEYDEWFRLLQTFYSMVYEGLIDRNQAYELCEIIDNGDGNYLEEFRKIASYGYTGRTIGSLIYDLNLHGIDTKDIFHFSERHEMRVDKEWEIVGYLSNNVEVCKEFKDILLNSPGKRILFVGDTGVGKSKFILDMLDEFNEQLQANKRSYRSLCSLSYSIMSIPRRNLINNLRKGFLTKNSAVLTGSDEMVNGQRASVISTNDKFLTTPDHAHVILGLKLIEGERVRRSGFGKATLDVLKHHRIMILDECHMLANDSTFKSETVERYLATEEEHLKNGGVVLHMTATPENLTTEGVYDLVIKVTQKNRVNPFREAGYKVLSGKNTNEVDSLMLKLIRESVKKNPARKLLVFIEKRKLIDDFKRDLNSKGIKAVGVYSKKEKDRSEEELSIIEPGIIPKDVQVILGTTAMSAGISIVSGFNKQAETWVYCSSSSMNHEFTRLVQMSNRFRTSKEVRSYEAFRIFFQESSTDKQDKVFRYHSYLEKEMRKAENSRNYIEMIRGGKLPVFGELDEMERNCGLFSDNDGHIRINIPSIESEGIQINTYNNYNNYRSLIKELEEKFKCQFIDLNESVTVSKKELLNYNKVKGDSKFIINQIASDEGYFNQLKELYMVGIKNGELEFVQNTLKGGIMKDLNHFLQTEPEFQLVSKVFKAHQKPKKYKYKTYCYSDDLKAIEKIKHIRQRKCITLELQLVKTLDTVFDRRKEGLEFKSSSAVNDFLEKCLERKLMKKGLELDASRFKPQTFQKLLNIEVKPSNGKKYYKLHGFKDEQYIALKYGLKTIDQHPKEVA